MRIIRQFVLRAWNVVMRRHGRFDLDEEIQTHLDLIADEHICSGMSPNDAHAKAQRDFGNISQTREAYREQWGLPLIEAFWYDMSFALRSLTKRPLLLLTTSLSIAVGAGLNIGVYSALTQVLFRTSLSGVRPDDHLAQIGGEVSFPNYADLSKSTAFAGLAAMQTATLVWRTNDGTSSVNAKVVSQNFFDVVGIRAAQGRTFDKDDTQLVVLGFGFWQRQFASDPAVIGQIMNLNGWRFTIAGVLPRDFNAPLFPLVAADIYVPVSPLVCSGLSSRAGAQFDLIARLRDGVSLGQASGALRAASSELARRFPHENAQLDRSLTIFPATGFAMWRQMGVGRAMLLASLTLYTLVGLILLITCANVTGMLLARAEERRREIVVCAALGASRWRQAQRFAAESAIIAILGCTFGAALYAGSTVAISRLGWTAAELEVIPPALPFAYCCALVVAITVACGAGPSLAVSRMAPGPALSLVSPRASSTGRGNLRNLLVILQITICFVLLSGAFLLLRGAMELRRVDPGFEVERTLSLNVRLPTEAAATRDFDTHAFERIRRTVERLPGVESVSCVRYLPLKFLTWRALVRIDGLGAGGDRAVDIHPVGPRYLETMRIPLLRGRDLSDDDTHSGHATATPVVVNGTLASRFFQTSDPIGRRLVLEDGREQGADKVLEVVGVARDSKLRTLNEDAHPVLYLPELHTSFVVRVTGPATAAVHAIEKSVAENEPGASVQASPMSAQVAGAQLPVQVGSSVLGALGALGLLLAMTGLYAVITYGVSRKTFEIGVRMAVGATGGDIARFVLREPLKIVAIGCAIGAVAALAATRVLAPLLAAGQSTTDPFALGAVAITLAIVGAAASLAPARRAARVDPLAALRQD